MKQNKNTWFDLGG